MCDVVGIHLVRRGWKTTQFDIRKLSVHGVTGETVVGELHQERRRLKRTGERHEEEEDMGDILHDHEVEELKRRLEAKRRLKEEPDKKEL